MRNYKQSTSHSDRKILFCSAHEELQWKKSGPGVIRLGNGSVLIGSNADAHILTEGNTWTVISRPMIQRNYM